MAKSYYTCMMSNKARRLYIGITSDLIKRVRQHKSKYYGSSFTARYCFDLLVYFEVYSDPSEAILSEKQLKGWRREKKLKLVLAENPDWADLSAEWKEYESWQAIPEAKMVLRRRPRKP